MENCRDTRALTLMRGRNSEKKIKKNCTPRSVVYSVRTLFRYVSKDKLKVSGKSQLDLRALYRKPSDWCHGWKGERRKLQPIIFVCYLSMASQTWQELVEFHTTVWEIETTGWEIQEKCKNFENGRSKLSNRRKIRLFSQATTIYISYRCIFTRAGRLRVIKCRWFFFFRRQRTTFEIAQYGPHTSLFCTGKMADACQDWLYKREKSPSYVHRSSAN